MSTAKRTILIAGMGTSPAVLTETVWALAQQSIVDVADKWEPDVHKKGPRQRFACGCIMSMDIGECRTFAITTTPTPTTLRRWRI